MIHFVTPKSLIWPILWRQIMTQSILHMGEKGEGEEEEKEEETLHMER